MHSNHQAVAGTSAGGEVVDVVEMLHCRIMGLLYAAVDGDTMTPRPAGQRQEANETEEEEGGQRPF